MADDEEMGEAEKDSKDGPRFVVKKWFMLQSCSRTITLLQPHLLTLMLHSPDPALYAGMLSLSGRGTSALVNSSPFPTTSKPSSNLMATPSSFCAVSPLCCTFALALVLITCLLSAHS